MARKDKKEKKGDGASDGPGKHGGKRKGAAASRGVKKAGAKASKPKKVKGEKTSKKLRVQTAQERRKVNAKLKAVYWAVQVGWCPGVYTSHDRYQDQVRGFSGAVSQKFTSRKLAEAFVGGSAVTTEQAQEAPPYNYKGGVKFDRADVPRGFALGFTRAAGRSVLTNRPIFSISRPAPEYLPDTSAPREPASRSDASDATFGLTAGEAAVSHAEAEEVLGRAEREGGATESGGGAMEGDFVALGAPNEEGDGPQGRAGQGSSVGGAQQPAKMEWQDHELPWYRSNMRIGSPSLRLHNEIVELTQLLRPTDQEDAQRVQARRLLAHIVTESEVPDSQVPTALQGLGRKLQQQPWVTDLEVVAKAKVPIVKLVIMPYGLKFDISIGKTNGLDAVNLIRGHLAAWPVLRPLVTILKLYLLQRNMNEVYSGGFGSFALITSVVAFLQLHQSRVRGLAGGKGGATQPLDQNLGLLLMDYFRFYGRALRYQSVGVSCAKGGFCFDKDSVGFGRQARDRSDRFSVMDPLDASNDVARGSFNSKLVRNSFDHAYIMLTAPSSNRGKPLLGMILRLNDVLAIRPPPTPSDAR